MKITPEQRVEKKTEAVVDGTLFRSSYKHGDTIAWINNHEILIDASTLECYRIAVSTTPPRCVGRGSRPYGLETFIEKHLGLTLIGQAKG